MRIHPDDGNLATRVLAHAARHAGIRADSDALVAAEHQHRAAVEGVRVDLLREGMGGGGDGGGALDASVWAVRLAMSGWLVEVVGP